MASAAAIQDDHGSARALRNRRVLQAALTQRREGFLSDIDLRAGTLTVRQARVLVEYRVRIEEPKSVTASGHCRSMASWSPR